MELYNWHLSSLIQLLFEYVFHTETHLWLDMILYKLLIFSVELQVFLIILGLQPCILKKFDLFTFVILRRIHYAWCPLLDLVPICFKYSIVNHILIEQILTGDGLQYPHVPPITRTVD